jgi:hypothetical protein
MNMVKIIECGKFKGKKIWDKLLGNENASASLMAEPTYARYTVKHSIQKNIVRVTIFDNKLKTCSVKATGHYVYNPTIVSSNGRAAEAIANNTSLPVSGTSDDLLYVDVDEPTENEKKAGVTLEQKIADAYVRLQIIADKMNYDDTKPYRLAEAVKKFEAHKDELTGKKP